LKDPIVGRDWTARLSLRIRAQGRAIGQALLKGNAKWVRGLQMDPTSKHDRQPDSTTVLIATQLENDDEEDEDWEGEEDASSEDCEDEGCEGCEKGEEEVEEEEDEKADEQSAAPI